MSSPNSKKFEFRKLKDVWYKKLEKSGFTDIEKDEFTLKKSSDQLQKTQHGIVRSGRWKALQDYYIMAEHYLNCAVFETSFEAAVWGYHSEGLSYRDITKLFNKLRRKKKTNRTTVYQIIKKHRSHMNSLMWIDTAGSDILDDQ